MSLKKNCKAFKETFLSIFDDNMLKLSASLSYYTVFSMGPLLLIIISIISFFFGAREPPRTGSSISMTGLWGGM
jgi:uncharacterized BrkB/YihY/UPF0761 family membrane protein